MTDRVCTKRWADGALFEIFDGCGKRASAQNQSEIVSSFLAEIAFDQAGVVNAAIDDGSGINAVFQDDGHLTALVSFGEGTETPRGLRREGEVHLKLARIIGIASFNRATEIASGDNRRAAQDIPAHAGVLDT